MGYLIASYYVCLTDFSKKVELNRVNIKTNENKITKVTQKHNGNETGGRNEIERNNSVRNLWTSPLWFCLIAVSIVHVCS